jgi:hypothetical protein
VNRCHREIRGKEDLVKDWPLSNLTALRRIGVTIGLLVCFLPWSSCFRILTRREGTLTAVFFVDVVVSSGQC